jgi:rRNA maturation endonuclease Nob1
MGTEQVKLVYEDYINYCNGCGTKFIVYYADEDNELYTQAVDICPYCGGSILDGAKIEQDSN